MDRYHIVSQFKQRERVVIIDPARDPGAVKPNSGKSRRDFDHPARRCRASGYAGSKGQPIFSTLKRLNQPPVSNSTNDMFGIDATLSETSAKPALLAFGAPASGTARWKFHWFEPCRSPAFRLLQRSLSGLMIVLGMLTQGSSFLATLGWMMAIPLGFRRPGSRTSNRPNSQRWRSSNAIPRTSTILICSNYCSSHPRWQRRMAAKDFSPDHAMHKFAALAWLTAESGMPLSKVTSRP
jgi:hypothetical protein